MHHLRAVGLNICHIKLENNNISGHVATYHKRSFKSVSTVYMRGIKMNCIIMHPVITGEGETGSSVYLLVCV